MPDVPPPQPPPVPFGSHEPLPTFMGILKEILADLRAFFCPKPMEPLATALPAQARESHFGSDSLGPHFCGAECRDGPDADVAESRMG